MENNSDTEPSSPGQILRHHREKLNLGTRDIAKQIHLSISIVEAIEADEYHHLSSPVYIKGYLYSYAKIVGADAERIIELYQAGPPPEILPETKLPSQASSRHKPVKAFTYLIILGLVFLLLLVWYQGHLPFNKAPEEEDTAGMIPDPDATFKVVIHPEGWQIPNEREPVNPAPSTDNTEGTQEPLPAGASDEPDSVILALTDDSWIEVYDTDTDSGDYNEAPLFYDLGRSGKQYVINGTAPFRVTLGFADGVKVIFNGKPFNHAPYSENNVAFFRLSNE